MNYYDSVIEAIGKTPLIKLSKITTGLPVTILAKVEYFNPGGSVKDRIGLAMIEDAEEQGTAETGWYYHRSDGGQYRRRLGPCCHCQGIPLHLRHARQDERR